MGETDCGETVSCSDGQGHAQYIFNPIFRGAVFSPCFLAWGQTMVGVTTVMVTSFKRTYARTVIFSASDPTACHCQTMLPSETIGHSYASLGQSLVWSLLLSPCSWYIQGFVCALQESISPVLRKFCSQIPLTSKVKLPRGSQSLCQIPRLGNLLGVLEPS